LCAGEEALRAGRGGVVETEVEGFGLTPPTPDGRGEFFLDVFVDVEKSGRAGSAVEIFVGAADGEVGVALIEFDGEGADGVTQIPKHERAFAVGEVSDALHVVDVAAFEEDMWEGDEGGIFVDGRFEGGEVGGDVIVEG